MLIPTAMYIVVDAGSTEQLQNAVRSNITEGYVVCGGISAVIWRGEMRYFQAMEVRIQTKASMLTPPKEPFKELEPSIAKRKAGRPKKYHNKETE